MSVDISSTFANDLETDVAECKRVAVLDWRVGVLGPRGHPHVDRRAGPFLNLQMACDEIRMEVRQKHVADLQTMVLRFFEIKADVSPRIDDDGGTRLLIAGAG